MQDSMKTFLANQLNTTFMGRQFYHYTTISSTMEVAKKLAREGLNEGTVIVADQQTKGRGRLDRRWLSPVGNLAMSIILRPSLTEMPQLIMIASIAVVRAIRIVCGLRSQIKWPNDVLINDKKVCGILIENEVKGSRVNFAIIGLGININLNPVAFRDISGFATSLSNELGEEVSRNELINAILPELEQLYLEAQAGRAVYREWQENMETLGKSIQVKTGESIEQGKAESVTETGNLILRRTDGSMVEIIAGDVTTIKD